LVMGSPSAVVALGVVELPTSAQAEAEVQFRGVYGADEFVVDTGSSRSLVDTRLLSVLKLKSTNLRIRATTVCSRATFPLVHSGRWSLGVEYAPDPQDDVGLTPLLIASTNLGGKIGSGLVGLDALSRFQYVVIDFTGAKLVLGPRDR